MKLNTCGNFRCERFLMYTLSRVLQHYFRGSKYASCCNDMAVTLWYNKERGEMRHGAYLFDGFLQERELVSSQGDSRVFTRTICKPRFIQN